MTESKIADVLAELLTEYRRICNQENASTLTGSSALAAEVKDAHLSLAAIQERLGVVERMISAHDPVISADAVALLALADKLIKACYANQDDPQDTQEGEKKLKCTVSLIPSIYRPILDQNKNITGYQWVQRAKGDVVEKNQLVKVVATTNCPAKIRIEAREPGTVTLANAPPTPDAQTCTKYKEVIYWATTIGKGIVGGAQPEVRFFAVADCDECKKCDGKANDNGAVKFKPD